MPKTSLNLFELGLRAIFLGIKLGPPGACANQQKTIKNPLENDRRLVVGEHKPRIDRDSPWICHGFPMVISLEAHKEWGSNQPI